MNGIWLKKGFFGLLVLAAVLGLVLTAGCTGSDSSTEATGAEETQAAGSSSSSASAGTGEVVHYTTLMGYLPTAPSSGWINGEAYGMQATEGGYSWSWASKDYESLSGDATVDIIIQDTNGEDVGQMALWDSYIEIETPTASWKSVKVDGYPAWVLTDNEYDTISQIVNVNNRFIVYTVVEDGKEAYLTVFNGLTDFDGIAGLA